MREIVSPLSGIRSPFGGRVDPYKVLGFKPTLVADMSKDYFRNPSRQTFGDIFTTSRLGNATMTDSDGLLKWAPHNLLTYSEDFSNAAWAKQDTNLSSATGPGGVSGAFLATPTTANSTHQINQLSVSSGTNTMSVFAKAGGYSTIVVLDGTSGVDGASFNLSTGTPSVMGTATAQMESLGDGWYRCSVVCDTTGYRLYPNFQSSFAGDGTSGIYIWGAHLYRSDLGGMAPVPSDARVAGSTTYVPTTSTAKYLPRRHNHKYDGSAWVDAGTLIETEARTNLVTASSDFDKTKTGVAVTSDASTGPDGSTSADRITGSGVSGQHYVASDTITAVGAYNYSVFLKHVDTQWIQLTHNSDTECYVNFDIQNGVLGSSGSRASSAHMEDVGNGWYRCSVTLATPANSSVTVGLAASGSDVWLPTSAASTSVDVWGWQFEAASTPSSYIPTSGSTDIRAADSPLTIAGADVPWPTPTVIGDELVTNGTFDTDSDWTKGTGVTISGGNLDFNATGYNGAFQSISVTSGSVYMLTFDLTVTSGTFLAAVGNGSSGMTELYTTSGSKTLIGVYDGSADQVYVRANPDFVGTIDNISVKEINPLSVCIQMEGDMTYADENTGDQLYFVRWEVDTNNKILERVRSNVGTGDFTTQQTASGVSDVVSSGGSYFSPGINVPFNIASRHGSTFINGAVDGTALTADLTPVALPDLSSTDLQIAYDFMGNVKQVRVWAVDIGDTGIAEASS